MKHKTYTEEQIIGMLKEHEAGLTAEEVVRNAGSTIKLHPVKPNDCQM